MEDKKQEMVPRASVRRHIVSWMNEFSLNSSMAYDKDSVRVSWRYCNEDIRRMLDDPEREIGNDIFCEATRNVVKSASCMPFSAGCTFDLGDPDSGWYDNEGFEAPNLSLVIPESRYDDIPEILSNIQALFGYDGMIPNASESICNEIMESIGLE